MTLDDNLRALRAALGRFPTGVAIATTLTEAGPVGITVNSFTSVSLDPALVLFCPAKSLGSHDAFLTGRGFTVNFLRSGQEHLSRRFATRGEDKWLNVPYTVGAAGGVVLDDALAYFDCETFDRHDAGDHTVVIGRVLAHGAYDEHEPLVFYGGRYREIAPQAVAS